jgi:uncharacterized protein (DUF1499 family)
MHPRSHAGAARIRKNQRKSAHQSLEADMSEASRKRPVARWLAVIGLAVAILCVLAAVSSGFGYRAGLWHFRTGFMILRVAFFVSLAAAALALAGLLLSGGARRIVVPALAGLVIALGFAYVPWKQKQTVDALPFIHDITTDIENPPEFVAAAQLRKEGDHPIAYDGLEVAAQQKQAYPDLAPVVLSAPKDKVFDAARSTIDAMGLKVSGEDESAGRLEATDTSLWYGFTDDLVVRVTETPEGTRVDVRSKSRVGRSDVGQNAKRIRTFLATLRSELG